MNIVGLLHKISNIKAVLRLIHFNALLAHLQEPQSLILLLQFINEEPFVGRLNPSVLHQVSLLILLLNQTDFPLLDVVGVKGILNVVENVPLLLVFALDSLELLQEGSVQLTHSHFLVLQFLSLLLQFRSFQILYVLHSFLFLGLHILLMHDHFVEAIVLILLHALALVGLFLIYLKVVLVHPLYILSNAKLPKVLGSPKHRLVILKLSLQLLFLFVRFEVVRRLMTAAGNTGLSKGCLSSLLWLALNCP
jgi:hypothetical protein